SAFGDSIIYLPSGIPNWEGSGKVRDFKTGIQVGLGFLEYNLGASTEATDASAVRLGGLPPGSESVISLSNPPSWGLALGSGVIFTLGPLLLISIAVILIKCIIEAYKCHTSNSLKLK